MNLKELYDPSKIEIPETDAEFWLALLRVRNQYLSEAGADWAKHSGSMIDDHVWHTWRVLESWLDQAFYHWRIEGGD